MFPPIPDIADYGISPENGFLPCHLPLERLPDPYYNKWEAIVANLQALILSRRLRGVIDRLPVLSTAGLEHDAEWRRAYTILSFMVHGYMWSGDEPADRIPPSISIPYLTISKYLEVPPIATYAAVCLWNFKPLFADEHIDNLENLSTLTTFTGSIDESWFYLVSVAIEARGGPIIPLMLDAIHAARMDNAPAVIACLCSFAERLDDLGTLLQRMHENCDPHIFYHRIRPFLAGSKNMADAGLPNGVIYDDGTGADKYTQYSGGSNAQSSIIQFFDVILGIEHHPTGEKRDLTSESELEGLPRPPKHNFLLQMRSYMPGPHRRFLQDLESVANLRQYVEGHADNAELCVAYQACLAMLRSFRDKHISIVSRYIVIKSREAKNNSVQKSETVRQKTDLATGSYAHKDDKAVKKNLKGTGGTALIPFLKQARDETGEPAIDDWAIKVMSKGERGYGKYDFFAGKQNEGVIGNLGIAGLAGSWSMDDNEGGLCVY